MWKIMNQKPKRYVNKMYPILMLNSEKPKTLMSPSVISYESQNPEVFEYLT